MNFKHSVVDFDIDGEYGEENNGILLDTINVTLKNGMGEAENFNGSEKMGNNPHITTENIKSPSKNQGKHFN